MAVPGECIATGTSADICRWADGQVVKLFRPAIPPSAAEREAGRARAARAAGVPTPAVLAVVTCAGRAGIVFEQVDDRTMLDALLARPERGPELAGVLAAMHAQMHAHDAPPSWPDQHDRWRRRLGAGAGLPRRVVRRLVDLLERLPTGRSLCHGDFHPGNVMLANAAPLVIDWSDAAAGDPIGDVARTCVLMQHAAVPGTGAATHRLDAVRDRIEATYRAAYARWRPIDGTVLATWQAVIAAARLVEPMGRGERGRLVDLIDSRLAGLDA